MRTHIVDCGGAPANVEVVGAGPPVLMIGTAVPMAWTRPLCEVIADRGFTVVNFDYEPSGEPNGDPEPRTSLAQAEDAAAVVAAVGVGPVHTIGVSRGGITAFGLASRHPTVVRSLTLVCPVAGFSDTLTIETAPLIPEPGEDPMHTMLRGGFSDDYLESNLEHAKELVMIPDGAVRRVARTDETPFDDTDTVTAPAMVVEFGADRMVGPEHSARYLAELPGAEHRVIDGAGHGWFHEQPSSVARMFTDFIRALPSDS